MKLSLSSYSARAITIALVLLSINSFSQAPKSKECSAMRSGTFKYLEAPDPTAYFVITDSSHTEYYNDGKYFIKSRMTWNSACQYTLIMYENTMPEFPFKVGDRLLVNIKKVSKDVIYYTSEINGQKWEASVKKSP